MERGDEALTWRIQVTLSSARLDRAIQYAVTPDYLRKALEYWIIRFRG
jgi:hypothetical protein